MAPKPKATKKSNPRKNTQSSSQQPIHNPFQQQYQPFQNQPFQPPQQNFQQYQNYQQVQRLPTQVEMGRFTLDENAMDYGYNYGFTNYTTGGDAFHNLSQEVEEEDDENEVEEEEHEDNEVEEEDEDDEDEEGGDGGGNERRTKALRKKWTPFEEVSVIKSYFHISEDKKVGNQQRAESFWKRVLNHFSMLVGGTDRTVHQLNPKYKELNAKCTFFNGIYLKLVSQKISGAHHGDLVKMAKIKYQQTSKNNTEFNKEHCWDIFRQHPKWMALSQRGEGLDVGPSGKRTKTSEAGHYTSSSSHGNVPDLNEDSTPPLKTRPTKGKQVEESSSKKTSESIFDVIKQYKDMMASEKEEKKKERQKIIDAKLEKEQLVLAKMRDDQRDRDIEKFFAPHDHLTGRHLEAVLDRKREIAARNGWECDF